MDRNAIIAATIDTWSSERADLSFDAMGLVLALGSVVKEIVEMNEAAFAPLGLTIGEFDVLATLRRSGSDALLSPSEIAIVTMVSPSGLTNRMFRLENAGLIVRAVDADDRRKFQVALTAKGRKKVDRAIEIVTEIHDQAMSSLGRTESKMLGQILAKILAASSSEKEIQPLHREYTLS